MDGLDGDVDKKSDFESNLAMLKYICIYTIFLLRAGYDPKSSLKVGFLSFWLLSIPNYKVQFIFPFTEG